MAHTIHSYNYTPVNHSLYAGMKILHQRKFLKCVKGNAPLSSSSSYASSSCSTDLDDSASVTTPTSTVESISESTSKPLAEDSLRNPRIKVMMRYVLCRDVFSKVVTERAVANLSLRSNSIREFMDIIRAQEHIDDNFELELYTHEGYPMNVNEYNEKCKLR